MPRDDSYTSVWTPELVMGRMEEAMETLRALKGDGPAGYRSCMPTPARDEGDAWLQGWEDGDPFGLYRSDETRFIPASATRARIGRMDEAFVWLRWAMSDERRAICYLASGMRRIRIARKLKCSRRDVYRLRDSGLARMTRRLNHA